MKIINCITGLFIFLTIGLISSCMKDHDEDFYFTDALVEFDLATTTSNAPGRHYPLLTARARNSGTVAYQINLLSKQLDSDQDLAIRLLPDSSTAIEGLHYRLPLGTTITLPAHSSTVNFPLDVLDFPSQSTGAAVVAIFEIVGNDIIKPSENYKTIAVQISLR